MPVNYESYLPQGNQPNALSTLNQVLQQQQQLQRQAKQDEITNSLHALQMQRGQIELADAQRNQDVQTGLQTRLAALKPQTRFVAQGQLPQLASLGQSLQPTMNDAGPMSVFNTPGKMETTQPDYAGETAKYYTEKGMLKEATGAINLTEILAKQAAQERINGSPDKAAEIEARTEKMTKAATLYSQWKKAGGKAFADQQAARLPELFGDINLASIQDKGNINTYDLPNGQKVVWTDDNPGIIHLSTADKVDTKETWGDPYPMTVGGKKAMVQKSSTGQIRPVVQEASTVSLGGDDLQGLSPKDVQHYAEMYNNTGQLPSLGMGKSPLRAAILKKASELARGEGKSGADVVTDIAGTKGTAESIKQQERQIGAMGSFVKNIGKQVGRFEEISKDLSSFDTRLLNVPLRSIRGRVAGSPLQAKVDMYLAEISSETGKLASGATASVAELSQSAREKWDKIHDPNLSMADLLSLLKETQHAGQMRYDSVNEQLGETKQRMRSGGKSQGAKTVQSGRFKVEPM